MEEWNRNYIKYILIIKGMITIIWIIWNLASWKDLWVEIITNILNIKSYQISDELKEIANEKWISIERKNLILLSRKLSVKYWDWYLAERICKKVDDKIIVLSGMRQLWQIEYLKNNTKLLLIWIDAPEKIRFNRVKSRWKIWDPTTFKDFLKLENMDNNQWVQKTNECLSLTKYVLSNEGTIEEYELKIREILEKEELI